MKDEIIARRLLQADFIERVAQQRHARSCSTFNGSSATTERYEGKHREGDLFWAVLNLRDATMALGLSFNDGKAMGDAALKILVDQPLGKPSLVQGGRADMNAAKHLSESGEILTVFEPKK